MTGEPDTRRSKRLKMAYKFIILGVVDVQRDGRGQGLVRSSELSGSEGFLHDSNCQLSRHGLSDSSTYEPDWG